MRATTRVAAWTALAIQPVFCAYWLIAGAVEPHYSPVRDYVSEMGASTAARPVLFDALLVLWGLSIVAAALAVRGALRVPRAAWPAAFLAVAGVAAALAGPVHLSCMYGGHAHCPGDGSLTHRAHNWLALANQFALVLSAAAMVWALWPRLAARLLAAPALLGLALVIAGLFADPHDPHGGLAQRIGFVAAQGWIALLAAMALYLEDQKAIRARSAG